LLDMTTQLLLDLPDDAYAVGMDPDTAAILDLIAGDPIHARDREAVVDAIRASVRPDGTVSGNDWRSRVPAWVYPRVVGATVHALTARGVLVPTGEWRISDDTAGRNGGKPVRVYRWMR
jgi:hypothetical protein